MNNNVLPSDRAAIAGVIDPDAQAAGTVTTGWIEVQKFYNLMAIVMAGTLGASATIDAKFEQATDGSGSDAKDIDGKAIAQLVKASNDDNQAVINLRQEEIDVDGGFTHVRLSMTVGTANSDCGAIVLGFDARYQPADHAATAVEVVA